MGACPVSGRPASILQIRQLDYHRLKERQRDDSFFLLGEVFFHRTLGSGPEWNSVIIDDDNPSSYHARVKELAPCLDGIVKIGVEKYERERAITHGLRRCGKKARVKFDIAAGKKCAHSFYRSVTKLRIVGAPAVHGKVTARIARESVKEVQSPSWRGAGDQTRSATSEDAQFSGISHEVGSLFRALPQEVQTRLCDSRPARDSCPDGQILGI